METMMFTKILAKVCMVATLAVAGIAHAAYPDRPIRIVLPYAAGGPTDVVNRLIAENLKKRLGQPIIIEARPGGAGLIAIQQVLKAPADGYTLISLTSTFAAHPGLFKQLPYDMERDFIPLMRTVIVPIIAVVHPSLPVNNINELVEYAKRQPGGINYATAGNSSGPHIAGEYFKSKSGIDMTHVPYKGEAPALVDVLGGQVKFMLSSTAGALPYLRTGRLKAIAVATPNRLEFMPEVKTIAESGYPGYEFYGWWGMMAPAGTPPEVVTQISEALRAVLEQDDVKTRLIGLGLIVSPQGPQDFKKYITDQTRMYTQIIRSSGITTD
jgi:tripartite-type tricarboxylate transporter receptor subunit TctC